MDYLFPDARILVFSKPPIPGKCKTRLIPDLGKKDAAALQAKLITKIIKDLLAFRLCPFEIWQSEETDYFTELITQYKKPIRIKTQQGHDLGERMSNALVETHKEVSSVLVIGSDSIMYSKPYLEKALQSLKTHSVVVGPALDGGYGLIGGIKDYPDLFTHISWGSSQVLKQTLTKLDKENISYLCLDQLWDIDTPSDLVKLRQYAPQLLVF
ncbi:TIGR04282 family arsenosugar biosynthesis glycosyltransferase [Beggiatoa alba]|nr:TIGR04282 family arsenosugar biosynthesis glycosyltransferase [Beggiatoa alba]